MFGRQNKFIFGQVEFDVTNRHLMGFSMVTGSGNRFQYQYSRQRGQVVILLIGRKGG